MKLSPHYPTTPCRAATRRARRGFTLVELMITVGIIAVLAALAIPSVYNYRRDRVSLVVAQDVTDFLRGLRHISTSNNTALRVRVFRGDGEPNAPAAGRGRIDVFVSTDNSCSNIPAVPSLTWSPADERPTDNAQLVAVSPAPGGPNGSLLDFCMKPDGRIVDPITLQPLDASNSPEGVGECEGDSVGGQTSVVTWGGQCNRAGVVCLRIASINDGSAGGRCPGLDGDRDKHFGLDHYITLAFSGEVRMVR